MYSFFNTLFLRITPQTISNRKKEYRIIESRNNAYTREDNSVANYFFVISESG